VSLPCIREVAVILVDVRDDQEPDEVERRAGGELQVSTWNRGPTCFQVGAALGSLQYRRGVEGARRRCAKAAERALAARLGFRRPVCNATRAQLLDVALIRIRSAQPRRPTTAIGAVR
jgi:hypothetical protein